MLTYKRTRCGRWVVFGPVAELNECGPVTVVTPSGQLKTEMVERLGQPFYLKNHTHAFRYGWKGNYTSFDHPH